MRQDEVNIHSVQAELAFSVGLRGLKAFNAQSCQCEYKMMTQQMVSKSVLVERQPPVRTNVKTWPAEN